MVHLASVSTDADIKKNILPDINDLEIGVPDENEFTASVYGSKFAAQDIPKHEMPEGEMPREVAYRLIK